VFCKKCLQRLKFKFSIKVGEIKVVFQRFFLSIICTYNAFLDNLSKNVLLTSERIYFVKQIIFDLWFLKSTGVNFINVKHTNFLYQRRFSSFYYVHVTREKLPKQYSCKKFIPLTLMKLTPVVFKVDKPLQIIDAYMTLFSLKIGRQRRQIIIGQQQNNNNNNN